MSAYTNYFSHTLFTPPHYQRDFARDFPKVERSQFLSKIERVALIALPFISLYRPLGSALSLSMGGCRCITQLRETISAAFRGERGAALWQMVQLALAVAALAGTLFNFTFGLFATSSIDLCMQAIALFSHLAQREYGLAFEDLLQVVSSTLYLAILFSGNLEVIFLSMAVQALLSFWGARSEWRAGRYPEVVAKVLMGMVRCYQAKGVVDQIQRRNFFLSIVKYQKLIARLENGRNVADLIDSPINDLDTKIEENRVTLFDAKDKAYDFGAYFSGFGKELVKGSNLNFRTVVVDGKNRVELDFKVNHVFRDRLKSLIQEMKSFDTIELKEILNISGSHATDLKLEKVPFEISKNLNIGEAYKISLEGLGTLYVGASDNYLNLYDRVIVRMEEGKNIYQLHEILSFAGLTNTIRVSDPNDIERLKIGQLFRTFYPREATLFERTSTFFDLSIDELKRMIGEKVPNMKTIFENYLSTMKKVEILPGRVRYTIPELSDLAYNRGARALKAAVTGAQSNAELFYRVASILKMGMISPEMRFTNNISTTGLGGVFPDFTTGGADSVFTQLIAESNCIQHTSLSTFQYNSKVQLLFSLDLLETGTYQYYADKWGVRSLSNQSQFPGVYLNRPNILDFVSKENLLFFPGNEIMIKERIPPSMITGIIVQDVQTRDALLNYFRQCNLIQSDASGPETILGKTLDQFIHVGQNISESWVYTGDTGKL